MLFFSPGQKIFNGSVPGASIGCERLLFRTPRGIKTSITFSNLLTRLERR